MSRRMGAPGVAKRETPMCDRRGTVRAQLKHPSNMTRRAAATQLREELAKFVAGPERTVGQARNIALLAKQMDVVPWRDELLFVVSNYAPRDEATGEQALIALAELILKDWASKTPEPLWRLLVPDDAQGLQRRWLDAPGRERAAAVSRGLVNGDLANLAFGEHEGRLDFRGYVEPEPNHPRWASSLEAVDFSGAKFVDLAFKNRSIRRSRFDGVHFESLRFRSSTVADTSFVGSRFGDIPILDGVAGSPRRCTFRRVDFSRANLNNAMPKRALFEDCDFADTSLKRTMFECDLVRCRFAGRLYDVTFWGRRWGPGSSGAASGDSEVSCVSRSSTSAAPGSTMSASAELTYPPCDCRPILRCVSFATGRASMTASSGSSWEPTSLRSPSACALRSSKSPIGCPVMAARSSNSHIPRGRCRGQHELA